MEVGLVDEVTFLVLCRVESFREGLQAWVGGRRERSLREANPIRPFATARLVVQGTARARRYVPR